jgi:hypothetical protein
MSTATLAGLLLIVMPVAFNVAFGMLAARFDYPDILRRPTDEVLSRFEAGGTVTAPEPMPAASGQVARARRGPRADAGNHVPRAWRRGLRVHVRVAEVDAWVIVEVAGSEPEAELLCSVLRGAGIECLPRLTNSGAGAGDGLGTVGAHDIMVSPQDAQDAREILHETR